MDFWYKMCKKVRIKSDDLETTPMRNDWMKIKYNTNETNTGVTCTM